MHSSIHDLFKRLGIPPQPPEALQPLLENRRVTDVEYIGALNYMYLCPDEWQIWFTDIRQLSGQRSAVDRDRLLTQMTSMWSHRMRWLHQSDATDMAPLKPLE